MQLVSQQAQHVLRRARHAANYRIKMHVLHVMMDMFLSEVIVSHASHNAKHVETQILIIV